MDNNTNGNSQIYIGMLKKLERKVDRLEILLVELLNKDNPKRYKVSENNLIAHPPSRKIYPNLLREHSLTIIMVTYHSNLMDTPI